MSNINNLSIYNNSKSKGGTVNITNNNFNQDINVNVECITDEKIL